MSGERDPCRAEPLHARRAALAQYLVVKKWTRWFLIAGSHDADKQYAEDIKRAAQRFGAEVVEEREFKDTGGARTTD